MPESSRRVLAVLAVSDNLSFTQLMQITGLSERTLRFALKRLKNEGIVYETLSFGDMRKRIIRLRGQKE